MSVSRVVSLADVQNAPERTDVCRIRLRLQNDTEPARRDHIKTKPVGRAYAVVTSRGNSDSAWDGETLKTRSLYDPDLKSMVTEAQRYDESSLRQLRTELQNIKEVRHSMENVRVQLHSRINGLRQDAVDYGARSEVVSRQNGGDGLRADQNQRQLYASDGAGIQTGHDDDETEKMRQATKCLYTKLLETERTQERERKVLEDQIGEHRRQLGEARESLQRSEERVVERDRTIEELQRLMNGMEKEHQVLAGRMSENERQLEEMRAQNRTGRADQHRVRQLEKETENLREKISHLNDMLKSQQRKVRQMIEQMQSSRNQLQEKDLLIQQLQERVEHLESENREMQDRLEYMTRHEVKTQRISPTSEQPNGGGSTDAQITPSARLPLGCKKPKALVRVLETS